MANEKLSTDEILSAIAALDGWALVEGKLNKTFKFADFVAAFGFMTQIAIVAEKMNHHPELYNVYSTVTIDLTTHDVGGISSLDLELARKIEAI